MSDRHDLAAVIATDYEAPNKLYDYEMERLAETILAAGYRKPRTITTAEELEALPFGSVILDPAGLSLHKNEFAGWRASNGARNIGADMLEGEALPATVLHEPEAQL